MGNLYILLLKHRLLGSTKNKTGTRRKISCWKMQQVSVISYSLTSKVPIFFSEIRYYRIANRLGAKDLFDIPGGTRARLLDERFSTFTFLLYAALTDRDKYILHLLYFLTNTDI